MWRLILIVGTRQESACACPEEKINLPTFSLQTRGFRKVDHLCNRYEIPWMGGNELVFDEMKISSLKLLFSDIPRNKTLLCTFFKCNICRQFPRN